MQIIRIKAQNLFSWQNLDLTLGLDTSYSLMGINGAGKSSIFEIIKWVLFKKTSKGNVKGGFGELDGEGSILFDNELWVGRNTKTPTQIFLFDHHKDDVADRVVEQEQLNDIIGCSYESFMAAIMCDQKRVSSFINEKTDSGKGKIFGEMLGCGILDKVRSKIGKQKSEDEVAYESIKAKFDTLNESLESSKMDLKGLSIKDFKGKILEDKLKLAKYNEQTAKLQTKYNSALDLKSHWDKWEQQELSLFSIKKQRQERQKRLIELKKIHATTPSPDEELRDEVEALSASNRDKMSKNENELRHLKVEHDKIEKIKKFGGECPTCGSEITKEHQDHLRKLQAGTIASYAALKKENEILLKSIEEADQKESEINQDIYQWDLREKEIQLIDDSIKNESGLDKLHLTKPEQEKPDLTALISQLNQSVEYGLRIEAKIKASISTYNSFVRASQALESVRQGLEEAEKRYTVSRWLFNNLPLIKLLYINENKSFLEDSINDNLSSMGLPFFVRIETQKELKSKKEIKDEFSFKIIHSSEKVADRDALSGGEETLMLLAVQFAINDLIKPNLAFEFYDEVFASLSEENLNVALDMIKERGKNKQIFSISHKTEISHSFDKVLEIKKGENGSYVD